MSRGSRSASPLIRSRRASAIAIIRHESWCPRIMASANEGSSSPTQPRPSGLGSPSWALWMSCARSTAPEYGSRPVSHTRSIAELTLVSAGPSARSQTAVPTGGARLSGRDSRREEHEIRAPRSPSHRAHSHHRPRQLHHGSALAAATPQAGSPSTARRLDRHRQPDTITTSTPRMQSVQTDQHVAVEAIRVATRAAHCAVRPLRHGSGSVARVRGF